ncbi:MAG: formylglycine-generating enzyme family protein [Planctomycetaceae bacterium]
MYLTQIEKLKSILRAFGCVVALLLTTATRAQDLAATRTPSADRSECLKRFVRECVLIEPGAGSFPGDFIFGASQAERDSLSGQLPLLPSRKRQLMHPFRVCRYETTQELYEAVMGTNPSRWKGPRNSAEMMSFTEANQFCLKLTALLRLDGLIAANEVVRLPTELEWEYCCRAGTDTAYSFGNSATSEGDSGNSATRLDAYAWHTGNAAGNDPAVGVLKPNSWGLCDVHGYLWEFVADNEETLVRGDVAEKSSSTNGVPRSQTADPKDAADPNASDQAQRETSEKARVVIRGGSWKDPFRHLTSASRLTVSPQLRNDAVGFRCVIAEKPVP